MRTAQSLSTRVIGDVTVDNRSDLRKTLRYAYDTFSVYRRIFSQSGISRDELFCRDPMTVLQKLPLLHGDTFQELTDESLRVGNHIVDLETSSGTTGPRKRRFISYSDNIADYQYLAEMLRVCGIGVSDSVACVDTDPVPLMVPFTNALDLLPVAEAYAYSVGPDFDTALDALARLDPSVIVSVPSILERCFDSLIRLYSDMPDRRLSKIVYVGESMTRRTRAALESALRVEVFGYYGASETASLGIECAAHEGIHLFTKRHIFETIAEAEGTSEQLVVTTLSQQTLPLLRYALGDAIELNLNACSCGLDYPLVEVIGRSGDGFSVLGSQMNYNPIREHVYHDGDDAGFMQLVLTRDERDVLTIVLPESLSTDRSNIENSLMKGDTDLDFLIGGGYLDLRFSFVDERRTESSRKIKRVIDLRESNDDAAHRIS